MFAGGEAFFSVKGACFGEPSFNPIASRALVGSCEVVALEADGALATAFVVNEGASVGEGEVRVGFETPIGVDCVGEGDCCLATGADVPTVGVGVTTGDAAEGEAAEVGELEVAARVETDSQSRLTACIN